MYKDQNFKQGRFIGRQFLLVFSTLILAMLACLGGGGGGSTSAKECVSVSVDKIKSVGNVGDNVLGTLTNNCDQKIRYAKIDTTCFSPSGDVVDRDPEYVEGVSSGDKAYYESVIDATPKQVDRCTSEVTEAGY